nr:reverse transcriptase domain-containing protein [Tanacetum cinerariifolium]
MNNNHNQEPPPHNGQPLMVRPNGQAPRTIEKLCKPSSNGQGIPIALIPIQATDFGLRRHMIQQVQNTCQFHGLPGDDANRHIDKFFEITQHMKQNRVFDDALRLSLFPYSLMHHAIAWYDRLLRNSIHSLNDMMRKFLSKYFPPFMVTKLRNEIMKFEQKPHESLFEFWERYKLSIDRYLKAITTQGGATLAGPLVSSPFKEVDREPDMIMDQVRIESTNNVPPMVVQPSRASISFSTISSRKMPEPVVAPNPKPTIPYPSRANKQKFRKKDDILALKFVEIFRNLHFELSFADSLLHMPKFALMFKSRQNSKEKLFDLATTPVNENCSAVILKKLAEKLGDPGKFLIPCDFLEFDECLAPTDMDASIYLMPLSIWKKFSLPELTSTQMILELAGRSTTRPAGIAEDVFVKRPFLRTERALIDVYGEELTLCVDDEAITFEVGQTLKYSYNDAELINNINVIDVACEEYVLEVLGFSNKSKSGSPTPTLDPIISFSSPSFTPFEGSDFILEEIKTFLQTPYELSNLDDDYYDTKGDILYLEKLLNEDPSYNLPPVKTEDLKQVDATMANPSTEEPPKLELKELSSHLEYVFLEGTDKLTVIISKELRDEEKSTLLKILNPWVSLVHCVPKKGGMTVVENENNELIPTELVTGWRVCIDYQKLNDATWKDHFPLYFMDQMLERLVRNEFYCILDGFSKYFRIPIDPKDQENTTFTCAYGTFAYQCIPFGLCNAPGTFQRCMMAIFHDMIEKMIEVFMNDLLVFNDSFSSCLSYLDQMIQRCEDTNLVLNWEKCHFMVKEGIVLDPKISKFENEVDRAKVDVIAKLPHPRFVKAHILVAPDWDLPFEITCDASDYAVGAVLGQQKAIHFQPIYYASKTMMDTQAHYTMTKKELLAIVYAFEKFRPYIVFSKTIVYTDHSALKYLIAKQDAMSRLLQWILLLQEIDVIIRDKKGEENLVVVHFSKIRESSSG